MKRIESQFTGNSDAIAAKVKRARVAYRPTNKMFKAAAAERNKSIADTMGGTIAEWNVPFEVIIGENAFEVKTILRKNDDYAIMHPDSKALKLAYAKKHKLTTNMIFIKNDADSV